MIPYGLMDYLEGIRVNEAQEGFKLAGSHWKALMLLQPEKGKNQECESFSVKQNTAVPKMKVFKNSCLKVNGASTTTAESNLADYIKAMHKHLMSAAFHN